MADTNSTRSRNGYLGGLVTSSVFSLLFWSGRYGIAWAALLPCSHKFRKPAWALLKRQVRKFGFPRKRYGLSSVLGSSSITCPGSVPDRSHIGTTSSLSNNLYSRLRRQKRHWWVHSSSCRVHPIIFPFMEYTSFTFYQSILRPL